MSSLYLRRNSNEVALAFQALPLEYALAESTLQSMSRRSSLITDIKSDLATDVQRDLVERLLLHNADTVVLDGCRCTAIQCAFIALCHCASIAKLLLEQRAKEKELEQQKLQKSIDKRVLLSSKGFVYLRDVDSTIVEELRYFTEENFVGTVLAGYESPRAIVTREAAEALSRVQADIAEDGYSLVIYDAYRPQRAVNHIVEWAQDHTDQCAKQKYYPCIEKSDIVPHGYVAPCSGHTRGSTLDLTIIKKSVGRPLPHVELKVTHKQLRNGKWIPYLDDGTVDMGTSFDFFGEASNHDSDLVNEEQNKMRNYLRDKMRKHGFRHLPEEWWHYTLDDEPYADTYFDFIVEH
jgi:D-alanyl-D-alanine dipeptidase